MPSAGPRPLRPAYDGGWVGGIVPAVLGGEDGSWLPEPVADASRVVLLVLDGVGWAALEAAGPRLTHLPTFDGGPITTVVPSTTSAALTSIATGLPPAAHGVLGFRIRIGGDVLNVLSWQVEGGRDGPPPVEVQPHPAWLGHPVRLVIRSEFRGSGFSEAHLRGGTVVGWRTTAVLVEHVRRLVGAGERFVYAYYDGVDKVAHEYGLRNGFVDAELAFVDELVGALRDRLPADCALVLTSDHGQVHVPSDGHRDLHAVAGLVSAFSGEPRFRGLHARPGAADELRQACLELFGDDAWVFTREQLFDEGWFGGTGSPLVRGRVGDVLIAPHAPVAYFAPPYPKERQLVSLHGSLTADEITVPLLASRGAARPRG